MASSQTQIQLSKGCVRQVQESPSFPSETSIVVQVCKLEQLKNGIHYRMTVSDGADSMPCILLSQLVPLITENKLQDGSIVRLESISVTEGTSGKKLVTVSKLTVLQIAPCAPLLSNLSSNIGINSNSNATSVETVATTRKRKNDGGEDKEQQSAEKRVA